MKKIVTIFLSLVFCISCNKDLSPIDEFDSDYEILIESIGKSQEGFIEFKFSNRTDDTLFYWGYSKYYPFYAIQILTDSSWANYGGWCGTGAGLFQFDPFESFNVNVHIPRSDKPWRAGLYTKHNNDEDGKYSWSDIQF